MHPNEFLQSADGQAKMDIEELETLLKRRREEMKRKEILNSHPSPIAQLPNGRWYTRIDGKKIERKSKDDLENLIIAAAQQRAKITINKIFNAYLERRKIEVSPTTWSKDIRHYNMYISSSAMADKSLDQLTLADGYDFLRYCCTIKPHLKRKYWNNIFGTLSTLMQYAIDEGFISSNPFVNLRPRKDTFEPKTKTRDGDTVFSVGEQEQVCRLANEDSAHSHKAEPLGIILLFNLGLRLGELCAIKWSDIELNIHRQTTIHIQREQVIHLDDFGKNNGYEILEHTKTEAGDRRLICNTTVQRTFKQIRALNEANNLPTGPDDFIFLRNDHDHITNCTSRSFDPRLRKYCKQANMTVIKSCHDIRRTVLTRLYTAGMPLKKIQEFAGHSSLKQTMDYIRISDDELDINKYLESLSDTSEPANVISFVSNN